ncbi:MAG: hypothetical protein U0795_20425 [Pirellulales bacterium]
MNNDERLSSPDPAISAAAPDVTTVIKPGRSCSAIELLVLSIAVLVIVLGRGGRDPVNLHSRGDRYFLTVDGRRSTVDGILNASALMDEGG